MITRKTEARVPVSLIALFKRAFQQVKLIGYSGAGGRKTAQAGIPSSGASSEKVSL